MKNLPDGIKVDRKMSILTINWKDEHTSAYGFSLLRHSCPCVECRGGHDQMSDKPDPAVFSMPKEESERTQIDNVVSVGSYAFSIQWADGHSAGIYNWDFLRDLCPCNQCRG